jgi:predicted secreted hydrolase
MRWLLLLFLFTLQLGHAAPPVFPPVAPQRQLAFPADFGAHPDYRTEWWYVTGWLKRPTPARLRQSS